MSQAKQDLQYHVLVFGLKNYQTRTFLTIRLNTINLVILFEMSAHKINVIFGVLHSIT